MDRLRLTVDHFATLTPHGVLWLFWMVGDRLVERLISPKEKMAGQGLCNFVVPTDFTSKHIAELAGNAYSAHVVVAVLLAMLSSLPCNVAWGPHDDAT